MSESESEYEYSPAVFNVDSSDNNQATDYGDAESNGTDLEILDEEHLVVPVEAMACKLSIKTSTLGHGDQAAEGSTSVPTEGILSVVIGNQRVPMAQPKGRGLWCGFPGAKYANKLGVGQVPGELSHSSINRDAAPWFVGNSKQPKQ
ncbi:unnamed protein product [Prunus armeniaca]